ncbi:hypothetical protein FD755_002832 [Muntiacus reevesi]|uniref:Uncharacterized protein n=1 Tax=Muntiacus reevesi TaxID=9886 RepID=A0A5J5N5P5_MUNRE|nr:hypothetical protein FD755_002832 [Muntiacus reevesi]
MVTAAMKLKDAWNLFSWASPPFSNHCHFSNLLEHHKNNTHGMVTPHLCFLHWLNTEKELSKTHHETLIRRSPGERNGSPLQYSCLENPMDRGAWRATVHEITRVGHDLATKPPTTTTYCINSDSQSK